VSLHGGASVLVLSWRNVRSNTPTSPVPATTTSAPSTRTTKSSARVAPALVELVDRPHDLLQLRLRRARAGERLEHGVAQLLLEEGEHLARHVLLTAGEVVIEARLAEPGGFRDLRQRRAVVSAGAERVEQAREDLLA
jgi:hypothetical protein